MSTAAARLGRTEQSREYRAKFAELRAVEDEASATKRMATDVIAPAELILAETLLDAGRLYQQSGRIDKAESCWRRAAQVDPTHAASRVQLVNLYRRSRRGQEAAQYATQLTEIDPNNAAYHHMAGAVFAGLGQFDPAVRELRRTIELAPNRADGYRSLAGLYLASNRNVSEARPLAEKAVALVPNAANYVLLSQACSRVQDRDAARAAMKRAAELDPNNAQIQDAYRKLQQEKSN